MHARAPNEQAATSVSAAVRTRLVQPCRFSVELICNMVWPFSKNKFPMASLVVTLRRGLL